MKVTLPNRVLVTLIDKDGKEIKKKTINKSLRKVATLLGLEIPIDQGDSIKIESEEM